MPDDQQLALRSEGLSWRLLADQVVVLDAERSIYLTVNGAGVPIWHALVRGATFDEIVQELTEQFEVADTIARSDASQFLDDLRARGLLADTSS
jgi:hypothetical protein